MTFDRWPEWVWRTIPAMRQYQFSDSATFKTTEGAVKIESTLLRFACDNRGIACLRLDDCCF